MGDYADALAKDLKRLSKELEAIAKVLKKDPKDAKALEARKKLAPFLTKEALDKRWEMAMKMDEQALGKIIKDSGLPW